MTTPEQAGYLEIDIDEIADLEAPADAQGNVAGGGDGYTIVECK